MGEGISDPILDHIRLLPQNGEASGSVIVMVPHLNLQGSSLSHQVDIIRLHPQCILEAFSCLQEILPSLVDGSTGMPTEEALHLALQQGQFAYFQSLCLFSEREQEERLEGERFGVVGMCLQ